MPSDMLSMGSLPHEGDDLSLTISEFCVAERMGLSTYHKLKKLGLGPDELRVPGLNFVRVTQAARREWHAKMAALRNSDVMRREAERRSEMARVAGQAAARSPLHVSQRKRSKV
jgi:hypothetical protein